MNAIEKTLLSLMTTMAMHSSNAQTVQYSDDNSYKGRLNGNDIVFKFNFDEGDSYSTFFYEKDAQDIFLSGTQKGDSLILQASYEPKNKGTFRLKLVNNNSLVIGTWESKGKRFDVTAEKNDEKEWAQKLDKKIAEKILKKQANFVFTPSDIIKLNALKFKSTTKEKGLEWSEEKLTGIKMPRLPQSKLNETFEASHYSLCLQRLNSFQSEDKGLIEVKTEVPFHNSQLLSLKTETYINDLRKGQKIIIGALYDVASGKSYRLNEVLQFKNLPSSSIENSTDAGILHLLKSVALGDFEQKNCAFQNLIEMGIYSWVYTSAGIEIHVSMPNQACPNMILIPKARLQEYKNPSFHYSL